MAFELIAFSALLAALVTWFAVERLALQRALDRVPVRILVNGSRGKSTVVRLVAGALREAGRRVVARTTGSAARLILPDGTERRAPRAGRARVSEVIGTLRRAADLGANAVVVECMAIRPDLQRLLAERIVRPTITVITNVRDDHLEVTGPTLRDAADAFAGTIPRSGLAITSPGPFAGLFSREAGRRGSQVVVASPEGGHDSLEENQAQALAVAASLGVSARTAAAGIRSARADPGALRVTRAGGLVVVNAFAANEPTSTAAILGMLRARGELSGPVVAVFNHRRDRLPRAIQFADWLAETRTSWPFKAIVVVGDRCPPMLRRLRRAGVPGDCIVDAGGIRDPRRVMAFVLDAARPQAAIVGMGNIAGMGHRLARLWAGMERG